MNRFIQAVALTLAISAPSFSAMAELKVATIDMRNVFQQISESMGVSKQLQDEFGVRIQELQKLEEQMQSLYQKRERDKALMSQEELTTITRELESLQAEYQLKGKNYEDDHRKRNAEEQQKLMVKVQQAVEQISKAQGYDLVLPIDATAYAKPELDISLQVIEIASKSN